MFNPQEKADKSLDKNVAKLKFSETHNILFILFFLICKGCLKAKTKLA